MYSCSGSLIFMIEVLIIHPSEFVDRSINCVYAWFPIETFFNVWRIGVTYQGRIYTLQKGL